MNAPSDTVDLVTSPRPTSSPSGGRRSRRSWATAIVALSLVVAGCASQAVAAGSATTGRATPVQASDLQDSFRSVVRSVSPSVVMIETSSGLGSGVVFDDQGHIVTNAHVAGDATSFTVTTADGRKLDGRLVGTFPQGDIAVIATDPSGLQAATFGDSSALAVGDIVMAVGNPLGLQSSVTEGIVSALDRTVSEPNGAALPDVIQTSAAINPGNSGGALADIAGEVIGIPTLAATDQQLGGAAPGIGFAIASNTVSDIARQLIADGRVTATHRAYLGVTLEDVQGGQGVLVYEVDPSGPAGAAGLPSDVLIVSIDGTATSDRSTLAETLATHAPGDSVTVRIMRRDGSTDDLRVTLGELPA